MKQGYGFSFETVPEDHIGTTMQRYIAAIAGIAGGHTDQRHLDPVQEAVAIGILVGWIRTHHVFDGTR